MSHINLTNSGSLPGVANIEYLKGNDGIQVGPNPGTHVLNLLGNGTQGVSVSGNAGTYTETITVANATTAQIGVVSLATNAETIAGTVTTKATTPDDIKAKLGTQTSNGIPYGAGTSSALSWTSSVNDGILITSNTGVPSLLANSITPGYVLTANTAAPPSWQPLPGTISGSVTTTNASTVTCLTLPLGLVPGVYSVSGSVAGFIPAAGEGGGYFYQGVFRTDGTTATEIGGEFTSFQEDPAIAPGFVTVIASGNNAIVQVTGIAATTIDWVSNLTYTFAS
jgi:hypothetical protein